MALHRERRGVYRRYCPGRAGNYGGYNGVSRGVVCCVPRRRCPGSCALQANPTIGWVTVQGRKMLLGTKKRAGAVRPSWVTAAWPLGAALPGYFRLSMAGVGGQPLLTLALLNLTVVPTL